jgi:hypothetical protein
MSSHHRTLINTEGPKNPQRPHQPFDMRKGPCLDPVCASVGVKQGHRGARPHRAQLRKRLPHTTAPCVRYTSRPTWWRHCHHKHSMWVANPCICNDGTLASRYIVRTLARAGPARTHRVCIPGATQTHNRYLPLVSVHLRAEPPSATRPPRAPYVPRSQSSPVAQPHTVSEPPTTTADQRIKSHVQPSVPVEDLNLVTHGTTEAKVPLQPASTHTYTVLQTG